MSSRMAVLIFLLFYLVLTCWSAGHAFFWDTVQLSSMQANWFYTNGWSEIILPENIDSGHPPGFGMYLAIWWCLLGKNLAVSHFAVLPFLWGMVWAISRLGEYYLKESWIIWLLILTAFDPVVLGQSILVSPDLAVACGFLLAWYGVVYEKPNWLLPATLVLTAVSLRGMMLVLAIYLFRLLHNYLKGSPFTLRSALQAMIPLVPAGLLGIAFLLFHKHQTGWVGYHPNSPWAPSFEMVNTAGGLKNFLLLGWRFADFGRITLLLILLYMSYVIWKHRPNLHYKGKELPGLLLCTALVLLPSMLMHRGLMNHRYLLPLFLILNIMTLYTIYRYVQRDRLKKWLLFTAIAGLISGNLWIYPERIAQGWDSTFAHVPYYKLRKQMIAFIDSAGIPYHEIGSAFPNLRSFADTDLNGRPEQFVPFDLAVNSYVLYSNVFNEFSDDEIAALQNDWEIVKAYRCAGICVILYRHPVDR